MKSLIVTADDYGMSLSVNKAIEECVSNGTVTSTNVMVNMPYCADAAEFKQKHQTLSVGLHWTLSAGRPVLKPKHIPTLVDDTGRFFSYTVFRHRYRRRLIQHSEIQAEMIAQYNAFKMICGHPDYWNTHQNVHVDFGIFQLFVDVASKLKITKMRTHKRIYVSIEGKSDTLPLKQRLFEPAKMMLLNRWQAAADEAGILAPNGLILCKNSRCKNDLDNMLSNIQWKSASVAEYVIHPATAVDCEFFGSIADRRIEEYRCFISPTSYKVFHEHPELELAGFGALH